MSDHVYATQTILTGEKSYSYSSNKKRSTGRRTVFLQFSIIFLVLVLAFEAVYYFFIMPATSVAYIRISGNTTLQQKDILQVAGLSSRPAWFSIHEEAIVRNLKRISRISTVTVEKVFPDKVYISVTERKPCAIMFALIDGKTTPMTVDKNGTIFEIGSCTARKRLPVISGLTFKNPTLGVTVHQNLKQLFNQIDALAKDAPLLLDEISEIKIVPKTYGNYELLLYPVRLPVKVRLTSRLDKTSVQYMLLFLDALFGVTALFDEAGETIVEEVDMRSGSAVLKKRGGDE